MNASSSKPSSARIVPNGSANARRAFTLIEVLSVIFIIGLLLTIAVPYFTRARETTSRKTCIANMRRIQVAKDSYLMDNNRPAETPASEFTDSVLYGQGRYIDAKPECPSGGVYNPNDAGTVPSCDYHGGGDHLYTDTGG